MLPATGQRRGGLPFSDDHHHKIAKMPFIPDPRYADGDINQRKAQERIREDVSMTDPAPYLQEQEMNLPRHKMKKA
jgi:hypothetical protein